MSSSPIPSTSAVPGTTMYPPPQVSPLLTLTEEQKKKMANLRAKVESWGLSPRCLAYCTDMCLFRYLKGLQWDEAKATAQLKDTLDWREQYKPEDIQYEEIKIVAQQKHILFGGFDKQSRPVILMYVGRDKLETNNETKPLKFRYAVYFMEKLMNMMPEGVYQITWLFEMAEFSVSMNAIKGMKDLFQNLGNYYTETLRQAFMINSSWGVNLVWNIVKGFLAKETVEKYHFIKGDAAALKKQLEPYIDDSQILEEFGGSNKNRIPFDEIQDTKALITSPLASPHTNGEASNSDNNASQ